MKNQLSKERLYTAKEISEQMGVPAQTIKNAVRSLMPEKMSNGKTTYFNALEIAKISKEVKKAHNSNLSTTGQVAYTEIEIMQKAHEAMALLAGRIKELEYKAEGYDLLIDAKNSISIAEYAKSVDVGRNYLFKALRAAGVLDKKNIPYQQYMHYFRVIQVEKNGVMYPTTYIYAKGIDYCNKILGINSKNIV